MRQGDAPGEVWELVDAEAKRRAKEESQRRQLEVEAKAAGDWEPTIFEE